MNAINFDELDQAVNAVLEKAEAAKTQSSTSDATATQDVAQFTPEDTANDTTTQSNRTLIDSTDDEAGNRTATDVSKSLGAKRSKGRFMDFVPKNSAAKDHKTHNQVSSQHDLDKPSDTTEGQQLSVDQGLDDQSSAADHVDHTEPTEVPTDDIENIAIELDSMTSLMSEAPSKSAAFTLQSPVDKRPLGASVGLSEDSNSDSTSTVSSLNHEMSKAMNEALGEIDSVIDSASEVEPSELVAAEHETVALKEDDSRATERLLPDELGADVVAVEAAAMSAQKKLDTEAESDTTIGAIKPQYQVKQAEDPKEYSEVAVFDATNYEQASKQHRKDRSGWLGVLMIIGLMLAGAALGAGVYYIGLF